MWRKESKTEWERGKEMAEINGEMGKSTDGPEDLRRPFIEIEGSTGPEDLRRPFIEIEGSTGHVDDGGFDGEGRDGKETLDGLLRQFVRGIVRPEDSDSPIVWRIKASYGQTAPHLKEASRNTAADVLEWTRSGSPLRALFVISVGTIMFLTMTGFMAFMLFFSVATFNAIVIALFMSVAAAGGVLTIFFISLAVIYMGALSVAVFFISTITISTGVAVLVTSGFIGFFYLAWIAAKKSVDLTKQSIQVTGSAFSAYSRSRHADE